MKISGDVIQQIQFWLLVLQLGEKLVEELVAVYRKIETAWPKKGSGEKRAVAFNKEASLVIQEHFGQSPPEAQVNYIREVIGLTRPENAWKLPVYAIGMGGK